MKLYAKLFSNGNFQGKFRWIHQNVQSMSSEMGFNDKPPQ